MKTWQIIIWFALILAALMFAIYLWQFADCDTIKALNTTTPGRCLP